MEKTVEEHYDRRNKKMRGIKIKYLIILALAIFDLVGLLTTFIFIKPIFIILSLLNILLITIVTPILYFQLIVKQPITSREYYMTMIDEYRHLDKDLLTKMFEMKITNLRNFIFAYLALLATFTLAIAFNLEKVRQYSHNPYFPELCILMGVIGIMVFVYYSFRLDRETIRELKELFKAMKTLEKLKNKSNELAKSMEKSRAHD